MNLAACAALRTHATPENSIWYRYIALGHLSTALSSAHTKKRPARFNPGPLLSAPDQFATLSLAENPLVAQFEAGAMFGDVTPGGHAPNTKITFVSLNITVVLHEVLDLTDINHAQHPLGTNAQELTGDWKGYHIRNHLTTVSDPYDVASPTQELGMALFATGVEGFRSISAKVPFGKTLTVFTEHFHAGSYLRFLDPTTGITHTIP
jgi:hypothetical protein